MAELLNSLMGCLTLPGLRGCLKSHDCRIKCFTPPYPSPCEGEETRFFLFPPLTRGKGGKNVMKIMGYHF